MNDISPEEKLFNIIDGKNSELSKKSPLASGQIARVSEIAQKLLQQGLWEPFRKIYTARKWSFSELNLEIVNRVLMVMLGGLTIFLFIDFMCLRPRFKKIYARISTLPAAQLTKRNIIFLEPLALYLKLSAGRDIFNPLPPSGQEIAAPKTLRLEELTKDLSLVGIFWGKIPEAMIEDIKEKKTYFLKKDQVIKGIKIDAILEDRVILEYRNQTMEFM